MTESKKTTTFVREATGLVKNVSWYDAISINMSNLSAGSVIAIITFSTVALASTAGMNLVLDSIIGFLFTLPLIVMYNIMAGRIARTGGDYVWASRSLGRGAGIFTFACIVIEPYSYVSLIVLSTVFAIGSVGLFFGNQNFLALAVSNGTAGANPALQFIVGALIFVPITVMNILSPKTGFKFVTVLTFIAVSTMILGNLVLLAGGHPAVVRYVNSLGIVNGTYDQIAASSSGQSTNLFSIFSMAIVLLPFFMGYTYSYVNAGPAIGSEIRGKNAIRWNVIVAALISFVLLTGSFASMYYAGGSSFINGALTNPTLVYSYSFNFWTLAMGVANNFAIALVLGLGWVIWNILVLAFYPIVLARYVLAQAFDRSLPATFSYVSPRFHSPLYAYLLSVAVILPVAGLAAYFYGSFYALFGTTVAVLPYFMVVGLAVAVYATRKERGRTRGLLMFCGVFAMISFPITIYEFLAQPSAWSLNNLTYGFIVFQFAIAIVIYLSTKIYYARKGIDVSLAFKEIPPE